MDEGYFMYFEDIAYCRLTKKAGWDILYWPYAKILHHSGGSSPVKSLTARRKRRPYYYYAARARYFAEFYGRVGLLVANLFWGFGRLISMARGKKHICKHEFLDNWANCLNPMKPYDPKDEWRI